MDVTSARDPQPSGISMPGRLECAVHVSRPAVADRPLYQGAAVGDNVRFGHADAGKVLEFGQPGHAVRRGRRYPQCGMAIGVLAYDRAPLAHRALNVERPGFDVPGEIAAILDLDDRAH